MWLSKPGSSSDQRLYTSHYDPDGDRYTKHYYAAGQRVATRTGGDLFYTLGDHLGSTAVVADAQGNEVGYVVYDAFGQVLTSTIPATVTDRLFTGQRFDSYMELYDYGARWYDPQLGRFISPDTIVPNPVNSQNFNRYTYVLNNPVNHTDPTGHECIGAQCLPPPQQIPWQEIARIAGPLVVAAPEAAVVTGVAVIGSVAIVGGSYVGATWAMQDMGPSNPVNPWTGGWTETFPLETGDTTISVTPPLPGTSTLGTEGPPITAFPLPEVQPNTLGLEFPIEQLGLPNILTAKGDDWRSGRNLTTNQRQAMKVLGLSGRDFNKAIHDIKRQIEGNPDVEIDLDTGDVFDPRSGEWIGNLLDHWD